MESVHFIEAHRNKNMNNIVHEEIVNGMLMLSVENIDVSKMLVVGPVEPVEESVVEQPRKTTIISRKTGEVNVELQC